MYFLSSLPRLVGTENSVPIFCSILTIQDFCRATIYDNMKVQLTLLMTSFAIMKVQTHFVDKSIFAIMKVQTHFVDKNIFAIMKVQTHFVSHIRRQIDAVA